MVGKTSVWQIHLRSTLKKLLKGKRNALFFPCRWLQLVKLKIENANAKGGKGNDNKKDKRAEK